MGGGVGRLTEDIVNAFSRKHAILYIRPGNNSRLIKEGSITFLEIKAGGKNEIAIPNLGTKNNKLIFNSLKDFSPDIIHSQDPGPISLLVQMWAKDKNLPYFYTSHVLPTKTAEFNLVEFSKKLGKLVDSKLLRKYFLNFFNRCSAVIALNKRALKDIRHFGYKGKIYLIPNGRDLSFYQKKKVIDPEMINLIFVGYLTRRKNQNYLIETIRHLSSNYQLNLAGPYIDEKYYCELVNLAKKYNLSNVRFLGRVDHTQVPKLLSESKIFVSASKMEVQSLAVMEALASGTPVVGLSNETIDEFVDRSCGYNFPPNTSCKVFAEKIKEICNLSEDEYLVLSNNSRQKVEKLDWVNVVEMTMEAYKEGIQNNNIILEKQLNENNSHWLSKFENIFKKNDRRREKERNILFKKFGKEDVTIYMLVLVTFLGNYFYSFYNGASNLLEKFKD